MYLEIILSIPRTSRAIEGVLRMKQEANYAEVRGTDGYSCNLWFRANSLGLIA